MGHLYGGFPAFRYVNSGISKDLVKTWPVATLWNHFLGKAGLPSGLSINEPKALASWLLRRKGLGDVVWSNGTIHRYLFPSLKQSGRKLILERGSMHPYEHFTFQQRARREAGFASVDDLPESVEDEIEKTKLADAILACSSLVRESYLSKGFDESIVHECDFGIDTDEFPYVEREVAQGRPVRLGFVGLIGFRKGAWRAVKIAEWAEKSKLEIELHFVGPIENSEVHQLFANTSATIVTHGIVKGDALRSLLASFDAYLFPSYEEGLPFSVLEAMSTGLPAIVSTDTAACEAAEHGLSGVHLSRFDHDEFDEQLAPLIQDSGRLIEMGKAAATRIRGNYTLEHYFVRIEKALALLFSQ